MSRQEIVITEENYPQVRHLMPAFMHELIGIIGLKAALTLVRHKGGLVVPIYKCRTPKTKQDMANLAGLIGQDAVEKLINCYTTQRNIVIPRCTYAMSYLKSKKILERFDELTTEKPNRKAITANAAVKRLAVEFGLCERRIWDITKLPI